VFQQAEIRGERKRKKERGWILQAIMTQISLLFMEVRI
jgi:ribosomal protein S6E (S10)